MYTEKARWMAEHRVTVDEYARRRFDTDRRDIQRRLTETLRSIDYLRGLHGRIVDIERDFDTFTGTALTDAMMIRRRLPRELWETFDTNLDELKRIAERIAFMKSDEYFDAVRADARSNVRLDEAFIEKYLGRCRT